MKTVNRKDKSAPQRQPLTGNPNAGALSESSLFPKSQAHAFATHPTTDAEAEIENPAAGISSISTVADAVERFYNRKASSGLRAPTLLAIKGVLDLFVAQFGTRALASITSDDIERFVETPTNDRGGTRPPRPITKLNRLKLVKALFRREGANDPFPDLKIKAPANTRVMRDLGAHYKSLVSRSEMERFSSLTPSARIEKS